jgi:hypothetical protein
MFVMAALIAYFIWPSDESRIRKLFEDAAKAAEARNVDGIMEKISYSYRDDYGMSYLTLREQLKTQFTSLSYIHVEYEEMKINVVKDRAATDLKLRVVATLGNETGYILGDIKTPLTLKITLEKERTKWLVTRIERGSGNAPPGP